MVKNLDMFSRFDRIPVCDRQTDGQTSCDGIVRCALKTKHAVTVCGYKMFVLCLLEVC